MSLTDARARILLNGSADFMECPAHYTAIKRYFFSAGKIYVNVRSALRITERCHCYSPRKMLIHSKAGHLVFRHPILLR